MTRIKTVTFIVLFAIIIILAFGVSKYLALRKAHSTFEDYYVFRGCSQLLNKTDTYGTCETSSGQTIKIVKYDSKWYLDGDLPWGCVGKICFGW